MKGHPPAAEGGAELSCFLPRNEGDGHVGILGQGDREGVQFPPVLVPCNLGKSLICRTLVSHCPGRAEDNSCVKDDCGPERRQMHAAREGPQHSPW